MAHVSPRLAAFAGAGVALVVVGAGALIMMRNSGDHSGAGTPPASAVEAPGSDGAAGDTRDPAQRPSGPTASLSGLPTCQTATATNCDRSNLQTSAGARGSAACIGHGTALLGASPIDLSEIAYIQPMGLMIGGHVTPIDHGYFYIKGAQEKPPRQAALRAPLGGIITSVMRTVRHDGVNGDFDDYAVTIEATCTFRVRFSNLVSFAGGLGDQVGQLQADGRATPNYKVQEGEIIGYTGLPTANGIDVWVENDDSTLTGFINPQQYVDAEAWKLHMADLFDYPREPLKSQLLALDMREASPRWGKIDYDLDGKLVGNWFRQGSGGYGGNRHGDEGYWDGHLSVVCDGNDPTQADVSFGNYQGQPQQFAVIGNSPDPAAVTQATGLVKYQLGQIVTYGGDTGEVWDSVSYVPHIRTRAGNSVMGTVLLQMTGQRLLQVEIFPGKTAAEVDGFDSGSLLYER